MKITEEKKKVLEKYFKCNVYDKEEFEQKLDDGDFNILNSIYHQTFEIDGLVFITEKQYEKLEGYNYDFLDYIITKLGDLNRDCIFMLSSFEEIMICKSWDSKTTTPLQIENNIFNWDISVKQVTISHFAESIDKKKLIYLCNHTQYDMLYGSLKQNLSDVITYTFDNIKYMRESIEDIKNIEVKYLNFGITQKDIDKTQKYNHIPIYDDKVINNIKSLP